MTATTLPAARRRIPFRGRELFLLIFPIALAVGGFSLLTMVLHDRMPTTDDLWPAIVLAIGLLVGHVILTWRAPDADQVLLPVVGCLQALGMVMTFRLAPGLASRQVNWLTLGLAAFVLTTLLVPRDLRWLRRYPYFWAATGIVLLGVTFIAGRSSSVAGPNASAVTIAGFSFQPPELVRILLVVFLAAFLERWREQLMNPSYSVAWGTLRVPQPQAYIGMLVMWGLSMGFFVLQRDMGQALLYYGVFLAMLYIATGRARYVVIGLLLFAGSAFLVVSQFSYVRTRFEVLVDPWSVAQAAGYQIVQGLISLAAGGMFGYGLGYGYANYIPAVHTDYIFIAIAEEWGMMGALAVLGLYIVFIHRGFRIADLARDEYGQLLAAGLTCVIALQTLIIIGGNLKLIPLTGVTLSFVSYGGSSLLTSYMLLALLLRVATRDTLTHGQG